MVFRGDSRVAVLHVVGRWGVAQGFSCLELAAVVDAAVIEFSPVFLRAGTGFVDVENAVEAADRGEGAISLVFNMLAEEEGDC